MLDSNKITFKKLELDDLSLMHTWLNLPFVKEWYGREEDSSWKAVEKKYTPRINGEQPTYCYIVCYDNTPTAFMQTYKVSDYPDYAKQLEMNVTGLADVDLFIGNENFIDKGLGNIMMKKFLHDIVFKIEGVTGCLIGPEPKNIRAIRSYEKAGFKYLKTIQIPTENEPEYLMILKP